MPSAIEIEIFSQTRHAVWVSAILQVLSEDRWTPPRRLTLGGIESSFEEQAEDAMDDKRCVLSDTECAGYERASLNPDEHPWGDDVVKVCRRFLAEKAGAAETLEFVDGILKSATTTLADELEALTLGEGGEAFARSVERTFKDAVSALKDSLVVAA